MQHQHYRPQNMGQSPGQDDRPIAKDFYIYEEDFSSLAANTSTVGNINIQADSDFMLQKLTAFADIAGAAQTANNRVLPLATMQITDSGSGRNLFEEAVAIPAIMGTGELPFILPTPKLFPARSTIQVTVANFSASTTYNVRLSFIGYKVFRTGAG